MNDTKKTIIFGAVALTLALVAWLSTPSPITSDAFLDQGEAFFPDFTDPNEAISLEILSYDATTGSASPFKVHFKGGRWTIPSHNDYPADAKDRLAQTAAGVIGIKKDDFRSDNASDHEACSVLDPLDEGNLSVSGRGQRVTLRGKNDVILADFIVGKEVPGRAGLRFVRVPDQKRVYVARMDVDLTASFEDWIETDLLQVEKGSLDLVTIHDYSIDERTRRVNQRGKLSLARTAGGWTADRMSSGEEVDSLTMQELLTAIDELSIVGVRPKPVGISQSLAAGEEGSLSQSDMLSLQNKGFFLSRDGQLLSNEGELEVKTTDGVVYVLRFGEVLFGAGLAVSAGAGGATSEQQGSTENRYLFLTTQFDGSVFKEPTRPADTSFKGKPDSLFTETDRENQRRALAHDQWQRNVSGGRELSASFNDRFADWYFVISAESFEKLRLSRGDIVVSKE